MREVLLRGKPINADTFMLCVPLVGTGLAGIKAEIHESAAYEPDAYEWRMDYFGEDVLEGFDEIKKAVGGKILICTMRSEAEGGFSKLSDDEYLSLLTALINAGCDAIDIELSRGERLVRRLAAIAKEKKTSTIVSFHDFHSMLSEDEINRKMEIMLEYGADIPKIACMAKSEEEAKQLFIRASRFDDFMPYILIAMGEEAKHTRLNRKINHSCLTFVSGMNSSAPGQMNIIEAKQILNEKTI